MVEQYQPPNQPHEDPIGETRQQLLHGLAVLATMGEAGARWAAVGLQNAEAAQRQRIELEKSVRTAQKKADAADAKLRAERRALADRIDGSWLSGQASFIEAATVWRTAACWATAPVADPVAQRLVGLAQDRVRQLHPAFMAAYDRHRAEGRTAPEASRAAAYAVWNAEMLRRSSTAPATARPHGGPRPTPGQLWSGATVPRWAHVRRAASLPHGSVDALDASVRAEAMRMATHVRPEALDELQRRWRATGRLPAADAAQLLRDLAVEVREGAAIGGLDGRTRTAFDLVADGIEDALAAEAALATELEARAAVIRGRGVQAAGTPDDPRTAVDEHSAGQVAGALADDTADQLTGTAEALRHTGAGPSSRPVWAQAFPGPVVPRVPPTVAGRRPAETVTPSRHPGRGR